MQTNLITDRFYKKTHTSVMAKFDKDTAFADRFRLLIKEKGWDSLSRIEIGKKIGTSGACATYYMNGDRLPAIDQARTICKIFSVNIEWLLTGIGEQRGSNKPSSPMLDKFNQLCPDQQREVTEFINFKLSQKTDKKPLTTPTENVGGGVNLPVQPQQSQDQRGLTKTRPNQFEIDLAIEHERCVMVRHQEQMEANARYIELVKDRCQNNECYCEPPCPDVETPLLGYMQIIEAVKK